MFKTRTINKYYKALVQGHPDAPQTLDTPLEDKKAITKILSTNEQTDNAYSLLDIQILTGRKHQIRQHLADIGFPIIGDRLYGSKPKGQTSNDAVNLCLTAYKMSFESPFNSPSQAKHYELGSEFYPHYSHKDTSNQ